MTNQLTDRPRRTLLGLASLVAVAAALPGCADQPKIVLGTEPQADVEIMPANPARQVAVDANNLYWLSWDVPPPPGWQGNETSLALVTRADLDGTNATTIATSGFTFSNVFERSALLIDGPDAYFTDQTYLKKAPTSGGDQITLAQEDGLVGGVAVDETSVYWTMTSWDGTAAVVMKMPKDGGPSVVLASGQDNPSALAIDATSVYWVNNGADPQLMKVGISGGVPVVLAPAGNGSTLAVDDTDVYFDSGFLLRKVPKDGGVSTVVMNDVFVTADLIGDANNLYIVRDSMTIERVSKADYSSTTVFAGTSDDPVIDVVTIDDTNLYWTAGGSIHRTAK